MDKLIGIMVVILFASSAVFADEETVKADADGEASADSKEEEESNFLFVPQIHAGVGYYNGSNGSHGVGVEATLGLIYIFGSKVGFRLEPGVDIQATFDLKERTGIDKLNLNGTIVALFGGRGTGDYLPFFLDCGVLQIGFVYKKDAHLQRTMRVVRLSLMNFYVSSPPEKLFHAFINMRGIDVFIGPRLQMGEGDMNGPSTYHFQPFTAELGFGFNIKSFSTLRMAGGIYAFELETADRVGVGNVTFDEVVVKMNVIGHAGAYLGYFSTGGRVGFYKLFNLPLNFEYVYSWDMVKNLDCLPGNYVHDSSSGCHSPHKWERHSVHRHMLLFSYTY